MKNYIITYDIRRYNQEFHREKIIQAENLKDAREKFDDWWYLEQNGCQKDSRGYYIITCKQKIPHRFHIKVRLERKEQK